MIKHIISIFLLCILLLTSVNAIEYFMQVGNAITIDNKKVTLTNVGIGGAIVIDVDGTVETISASTTKTVNGIEISNDETFYEDTKSERAALLDLSFTDVDILCFNGIQDSRTQENGIDCEGFCNIPCPTCDDNIKNQDESDVDCGGKNCKRCSENQDCNSDEDCVSEECSNDDKCCPKVKKTYCENGELISKGKDDGCHLGYSCCGDGICEYKETKENCAIDCCKGCLDFKYNCLDMGERLEFWYCAENRSLEVQKSGTDSCEYDYECLSSVCVVKQCTKMKEEQLEEPQEEIVFKEIEEPKELNLSEKLFNWFVSIF